MTRVIPILFVMAIVVGALAPAEAQRPFPPKSFENLQVLTKGASAGDVINTMKGFTGALGVRCQHCHVGKEGLPTLGAARSVIGMKWDEVRAASKLLVTE